MTTRVTSLLVLVPAALVVLLADWWRLRCQRSILEDARDRERKLRLSERAGRTAAERKLRQGLQQQQQQAPACNSNSECAPAATGPCTYIPIGRIASCFIERRGTPRQGLLAPAARATLKLDAHVVQPRAALEGLEDFSHVWLLYDFHENTNATKLKPLGGSSGGGDGGSSSSSGGSRTSQVKAKVHPPGLGGERVGLFATRTPHRPNPIGLSAARLLEIRGDTLVLGGADLVDGTPILDVKPYLRHDLHEDARVPSWCERPTDASMIAEVRFAPSAALALDRLAPRMRFYSDAELAREAIEQMLRLDIRSVVRHRRPAPAAAAAAAAAAAPAAVGPACATPSPDVRGGAYTMRTTHLCTMCMTRLSRVARPLTAPRPWTGCGRRSRAELHVPLR